LSFNEIFLPPNAATLAEFVRFKKSKVCVPPICELPSEKNENSNKKIIKYLGILYFIMLLQINCEDKLSVYLNARNAIIVYLEKIKLIVISNSKF
jgi:hypothetical protein